LSTDGLTIINSEIFIRTEIIIICIKFWDINEPEII
jgi:hypothetical protein